MDWITAKNEMIKEWTNEFEKELIFKGGTIKKMPWPNINLISIDVTNLVGLSDELKRKYIVTIDILVYFITMFHWNQPNWIYDIIRELSRAISINELEKWIEENGNQNNIR